LKRDHLTLSADQVTTDEHEANSYALLHHLYAAYRFLRDLRKKLCQHDAEYKDEEWLERIYEKNQRNGREERRVKGDSFADAE